MEHDILESEKVFSWTAVFVAALIGFGLTFLLNLLSLAIGISIFTEQTKDTITFSIIGIICFVLVAIVSMFFTGWIAGKLTRLPYIQKYWGCLYGFTAWCLSFILTIILLMNTLQFTQFHSNFTSKNLTAIKISSKSPMLTQSEGTNSETEKKVIAINAYVAFIFFFIGACSSTVGGYTGFRGTKNGKYLL